MVHVSSGDDSKEKGKHRMIIDATAGAIAGCIARVITGPLDVIKIRFQVQLEPIMGASAQAQAGLRSKYTGFRQALTTIVREEGVPGLWRGTVPGLLLTVPYTAVQFVALQQVRQAAAAYGLTGMYSNPGSSPLISLASGALAGAAATVASYPFDLLRTTLAAQGEPKVYRNMWDAARGIVSQRGPVGLYSGLGVTLIEIMPYAALQFGLYDALNALVDEARIRYQRDSSRVQAFACGLLAGLFAKLATHPLDVAKKRYQVAGLRRSLRYGARVDAGFAMRTLAQSLSYIYRTEGLMGLWKGSVPSIVKAAPSAAITFAAYDAVLAWLLVVSGEHIREQQQQQRQSPKQSSR
ncbi:mitochondrial substrate carrier [Volvox carteri f. nagariensis]|uniref:Mitochondrial substrate carrier n=1 Tax=Volvox carteri f. nagariensis TaxID=3068 RepID=D8UJN7_VOLCA|nr:mitochondrial substrate carrier [Volvox carteri f. nagariensis]EFJ40054.1 mitochondrial substrate carrier [Volvox carteri f. nagariensis]|eukprot:XP_002958866.1 mitochondrial substrate carrier [Volvox carteri f. nagariensis]